MSLWKINDVGLDAVGIDNMILNLNNQDNDYVEFKIPKTFRESFQGMFMHGQSVVVKYGADVFFRGKIDGHSINVDHSSGYHSFFAYGPWKEMSNTALYYAFAYTSGTDKSTHAVFSGDAATILQILLTAAGSIIQIGTIDVGSLSVPKMELYDSSIAAAIRSVLAYIPGALVVFDYSFDPPKCHVLKKDSPTLATVTVLVDGGQCGNLSVTPREDLVLSGVQLFYEVRHTVKRREWRLNYLGGAVDETLVVNEGYKLLSVDTAGAMSGNILRKTICLSGSLTDVHGIMQIQTNPHSLAEIQGSNWEKQSFFHSNCVDWKDPSYWEFTTVDLDISATNLSNEESHDWGRLFPLLRIGGHAGDPFDTVAIHDVPTDLLSKGVVFYKVKIKWSWTHQTLGSGTWEGEQIFTFGQINRAVEFNEPTDGSHDDVPQGIASLVLAQNSGLIYTGSFLYRMDHCPMVFFGLAKKLILHPLGISTTIQRISYDVNADLASISFGTADHLGPQDFISLYRA